MVGARACMCIPYLVCSLQFAVWFSFSISFSFCSFCALVCPLVCARVYLIRLVFLVSSLLFSLFTGNMRCTVRRAQAQKTKATMAALICMCGYHHGCYISILPLPSPSLSPLTLFWHFQCISHTQPTSTFLSMLIQTPSTRNGTYHLFWF